MVEMSVSERGFAPTSAHRAHTLLRDLSDCKFTGTVEALGELVKLTKLYVSAGVDDVATLFVASVCGREGCMSLVWPPILRTHQAGV